MQGVGSKNARVGVGLQDKRENISGKGRPYIRPARFKKKGILKHFIHTIIAEGFIYNFTYFIHFCIF